MGLTGAFMEEGKKLHNCLFFIFYGNYQVIWHSWTWHLCKENKMHNSPIFIFYGNNQVIVYSGTILSIFGKKNKDAQ